MIKHVMFAVALLTATPASAQTYQLNQGRLTQLQDKAKYICREVMETKEHAGKEFDRLVAPLLLNDSEYMILLSMCILYAQGRVDGLRSR